MFRQFWFSKRLLQQRFKFKRSRLPTGVVVAALTVLALITSVHVGYAQTPVSGDIRSEIRSLAANDVEDGISRRTNDAIKWYGGKAPGLTDQEIRKIYDDEYTNQTKVKKTDPRELLKPENGWFAALLVFFIAIFQEKLRKWITALWDGASNAIFNRFAGNQIFWQRALGRYRKSLIKEYHKRKSIFQQEDQLLNMQQVYVSLQVKGKNDDRTQFDADQAIAEFRRLMVSS